MQDQIKTWAAKLGVTPQQVQSAISTVMVFIQSKVPTPVWEQIVARMPQARGWASEAATMSAPVTHVAGAAHNKITGGLDLPLLLDELQKSGFNADSAMQLLTAVLRQLQTALGNESYEKVLAAIPGLGAAKGLRDKFLQ